MARSSAICVFTVLVGVLAMSAAGPSLAKVSTEGLLGLWMMDDDGGQEAEDSSGNDAHMAFDAGGGDWVDGKFGGAIEFGAAGFMDAESPLLPETKGFTMGCWINPASEQKAFTNIMSSHQEPPQRGISFEQNNLEHNSYGVAMGAGQWMGCGNTQFFMDEGEWGHMTIVREDDGVFAHAYKNGEAFSKDQICGADDPIIEPTSNFRIGNWVLGGREYDGLVDEAFLFDRAISAADVAEIAEKGWEKALGVEPGGKMTTTWASMKTVQ